MIRLHVGHGHWENDVPSRSSIDLPLVEQGKAIPRIIHQTYFLNDTPGAPLPKHLRDNVVALVAMNPSWEHRLYDLAAMRTLIQEQYGAGMLDLFERINPDYGAARSDFFRYLLLYHTGGVYLDVKSRFLRPLDAVLRGDEGFIVSHWDNAPGEPHEGWGFHEEIADQTRGEIQQWHVIAAPGHPFLRAVIERVVSNIETYRPWRDRVGWRGVLRLTGPISFTQTIAPLLDRHAHLSIPDHRALDLVFSTMDKHRHQELFGRHYSQAMAPVVIRRGLWRWADLAFTAARKVAMHFRKRRAHTQ